MDATTIKSEQSDVFQSDVKILIEINKTDFSVDQLEQLQPKVDELSKKLETEIELPTNSQNRRALLMKLQGQLLDILPQYSKQAEEFLSKSMKLNPGDADTWNTLGHVLWKQKDYDSAKNCYESANEQCGKNKRSLRELSIVLRCLGTGEERKQNVEKSVLLAQQAVGLDFKDGESWYILGNAYLSNFFVNMKTIDELRTALQSYNQAETFATTQNPDLHFNRGNIHTYLLDLNSAIQEYKKAHLLDVSLKSDQQIERLSNNFRLMSTLVASNGQIQSKKLANMVKSIPNSFKNTQPQQFGNVPYQILPLQSLKQGINKGVVYTCQVTNVTSKRGDVPASFVTVDYNSHFGGLHIYNTTDEIYEQVREASDIYVLDPVIKTISIDDNGQENKENPSLPFRTVQVFQLDKMYSDSIKVTNTYSPSVVVNETFQS